MLVIRPDLLHRFAYALFGSLYFAEVMSCYAGDRLSFEKPSVVQRRTGHASHSNGLPGVGISAKRAGAYTKTSSGEENGVRIQAGDDDNVRKFPDVGRPLIARVA